MNRVLNLQDYCRKMKLWKLSVSVFWFMLMFGAVAVPAACIAPQRPFLPTDQSSWKEYQMVIRSDFEDYFSEAQHYFQCADFERGRVLEEAKEVTEEYETFLRALSKD